MEATWPVFRIHHQRSRYIYDLFYKRKLMSRELYDYLLKNKYADANLIAKWKKVSTSRGGGLLHRRIESAKYIFYDSLDLRNYVVFVVFSQKIQTLVRHAFVEFQRKS